MPNPREGAVCQAQRDRADTAWLSVKDPGFWSRQRAGEVATCNKELWPVTVYCTPTICQALRQMPHTSFSGPHNSLCHRYCHCPPTYR